MWFTQDGRPFEDWFLVDIIDWVSIAFRKPSKVLLVDPRFWFEPYLSGAEGPGLSVKIERQGGEGDPDLAPYNPNASLSISVQRQQLPIFKVTQNQLERRDVRVVSIISL